jgi:uncharacterized Tic20 family protein
MSDQQGWGPQDPGNQGPGPSQLSPQDEKLWGTLVHVSALVFAFVALAVLGPLLILLIQGPKSGYVRQHAVEALNFNITVLLAAIVSGILTIVLIGIPMLVAVGIFWLVCTILAILAANRGEVYRYPLTLRLVS